jgi:hypothetical protein
MGSIMSNQKHFNYDGQVKAMKEVQSSRIEIKAVEFLTPARIKAMLNGQEKSFMVNVDIINRKVYEQSGGDALTDLSDLVFEHLDSINILPEDFFAAPDDVSERAAMAEEEHEQIKQDIRGDYHG